MRRRDFIAGLRQRRACSLRRSQSGWPLTFSGLDLLVIQIDGIHIDDDVTLVAAVGVDAKGAAVAYGACGFI
jgi:hypothetical protein